MKKYYKQLKNKRYKNIKKQYYINKEKTYFDKLYIRIFLSSLLLLFLISSQNIFNLNIINNINNHMNILPILNLFTNMNDFYIDDIPVELITNYENVEYSNGINYITNKSFNGVSSACSGIVVRITKQNNLYNVTIKSEDDLEYTYGGLSSIDVSLYSYVVTNNTIGTAFFNDQNYSFTLEIKNDSTVYSLSNLNNAKD